MSIKEPHEILNELTEKVAADGESSLSIEELAIFRTAYLLFLIENGGLSGFLYNVGPTTEDETNWTELRDNIDALKQAGCEKPAKVLEEVLSIIQKNPDPCATPWDEYIESADASDEYSRLEAELNTMIQTTYADLERATERYQSNKH